MPVTKTARRALRSSENKTSVNKIIVTRLEAAIRIAKKSKSSEKVIHAMSLADKAAKKKVIHRNKSARLKSQLSKLLPKSSTKSKVPPANKAK